MRGCPALALPPPQPRTHLMTHAPLAPSPQCVLAAASFRHDLALSLDAAGLVRGVEIRPLVPVGYAGCSAEEAGAAVAPPPGGMRAARLLATPPEAAVAIPVAPGGKGAPFLGQREVDDAEVSAVTAAVAGEPLDAETLAALKRARERDQPKEQTFLQKYWMYILIAYMLFSMASKGEPPARSGSGAPQQGAAAS